MKLGRMTICYETLAAMLGIPAGHSITAMVPPTGDDIANQKISFIVSGPQLPDHFEGAHVQQVSLTRDGRGKTFFS